MIIREVYLNNFISYEEAVVKFPIGVTVIVGENGAGKTAILDAITYALFKEHSRGRDENLIRRRMNNSKIKLRFSVRGKNFEVEWNLSRGRSPIGNLKDLDEGYSLVRPGSGERTIIPEIAKLTGLDKEVFINAIYVKQGEIAKFLDAKPSERKKIIGQLLGIEELEKIWEAMRDPLKDLEAKVESYALEVERIEVERRRIQEELETLSKKQDQLREIESEKAKLREEIEDLRRKIDKLEEKRKRWSELESLITSLEKRELENRSQKERLDEKIRILEEASSRLREYEPLNTEKMVEEGKLHSLYIKRDELEGLLQIKRLKREEVERVKGEKQFLEAQVNQSLDKFKKVTGIEVNVVDFKEVYEQVYKNVKDGISKINVEMQEKMRGKQKYYKLGIFSTILGTTSSIILLAVSGISMTSLIISSLIVVLAVLSLITSFKKQKILEDKINSLLEERQRLEMQKSQLEDIRVNEVHEKISRYNKIEEKIIELEEDVKDLDILELEYQNLRKDIEKIQNRVKELQQYSDGYMKALGVLEREGLKNIEELEERIKELKQEKANIEEELEQISSELAHLREEECRIAYNDEEYRSAKERYILLQEEMMDIEKKIAEIEADIKYLSREIEELKADLERLEHSREAYIKLRPYVDSLNRIREIFYKDGILQKTVRRSASTLIEEYARLFLQEFNLPFSDIRIDEDFNIFLDGRDGEQTLETLSGGEKIAIALILRLSIAASLAGEAFELIIMDEPTIHLDSERRRELINMFKKFRGGKRIIPQVILVSHDRELEEAADEVFEVVRSEGISKIKSYI
ncbi:MAG: AAA family ATPase [Candidatus Caldarchaeales archaeon]